MKAHVCIGGPLDGQHAILRDFYRQDPGERFRRAIEAGTHRVPAPPRIIVRPTAR